MSGVSTSRKDLIIGILAIIGGTLIHFTFGYFYTIANMVPYMYSYLKERVDPNLQERYFLWFSAVALGVQGIAMPLGGIASRKFGFRIVVGFSCLFKCGGVLLTYFTIQKSFVLTLVTYSVLLGIGVGFGYAVVLHVAGTHFPNRRGLVVGIIVGGFGLGALIFTPIQTLMINPNNEKTIDNVFKDEAVLNRIPKAFLYLSAILFGLQVIGLLLLRPKVDRSKPQEKEPDHPESEHLSKKAEMLEKDGDVAHSTEVNLSPKQMLRSIDYYMLWFVMFCNIIPITVITSAYKLFGQKYINNDSFLSAIASISAIFNCAGRIVWGALVDKISFKIPLMCMLAFWSFILFTFPHLHVFTGVTLKVMYAVYVCMLFFSLSGVFAIMPAATSIVFGPQYFPVNYGLIFNAFFAGALICALFATFLPSKDAYLQQFTGCACVCIMALFTVMWIYDRRIAKRCNICRWCSSRCAKCRHDRDHEYDSHELQQTRQ